MPSSIEQVHRAFKDRGLAVLAINMEEGRAHVAKWAKARKISIPILLDGDGAVTRAYGITGAPTVFLISRDGTLVAKAIGPHDWTAGHSRALLEALVAR